MRKAALAAGLAVLVGASLRREETLALVAEGALRRREEPLAPRENATALRENATETQPATAMDPRYFCEMCGYVYTPEDGVPPGSAFDDLPDTWTCPRCGAIKQMFKLKNTSKGDMGHTLSPGPTPASGALDLPATSFAEIATHSMGTRWTNDDLDARSDADSDTSREKWKYPTEFGSKTGQWLLKHLQKEKSDLRKSKDSKEFYKLHPDLAKLQTHFLNGLQKMAKTYNVLVSNVDSDMKSVQRWQKAKEHVKWYDRVDETALRGDFDRIEDLAEKHPDTFSEKYGNQKLDWPPVRNGLQAEGEESEGNEDSAGTEGREDE